MCALAAIHVCQLPITPVWFMLALSHWDTWTFWGTINEYKIDSHIINTSLLMYMYLQVCGCGCCLNGHECEHKLFGMWTRESDQGIQLWTVQ